MAHLDLNVVAGQTRQLWCDGCLTSARYEVHVYVLGDDGPIRLGTARGCDRCGPDEPADDGHPA